MSSAGITITGQATGQTLPVPPTFRAERNLSPGQWGLFSFLVSEVALFGTLIVTYVFYLGKDTVGPTPAQALSMSLVLFNTVCLLASSGTVHLAERTLRRGNQSGFIQWWLATIVLGMIFLGGTAFEWRDLIHNHHLTISRNLFGTTYYTLVGLHALHVTGGVIIMVIVLGLALGAMPTPPQKSQPIATVTKAAWACHPEGVGLVSYYWHFVDVVWVVVFTVVYSLGR